MIKNELITLFEIPGVILRDLDGKILGEVLVDYPKHSQLMVGAALKNSLDAIVEFVDMK